MTQQIGQPLRVFHVGLAARRRLDVVGVDDQHLALLLEQVKHWTPV
jgi:hypothetical protein